MFNRSEAREQPATEEAKTVANDDLEKSLRDEVETYTNSRLRGLQEEIVLCRSHINEVLNRLSERLLSETPTDDDATPTAAVTVAIAEHLRGAHKRGVEEAAAQSARVKASTDMAILKAAIDDIDNQRTQANILNALVNRAAMFAPRVVFFVIKNDRATGWRARGLAGTIGDDAVREISLPLVPDMLLSNAVKTLATYSEASGWNSHNLPLLSKLGDEMPQRTVAVPLVARGRAVAVLYADCAKLDPEAIKLEALEALVRVAGMAVELLATARSAPPPPTTVASDAAAATASSSIEPSSFATSARSAEESSQASGAEPSAGSPGQSVQQDEEKSAAPHSFAATASVDSKSQADDAAAESAEEYPFATAPAAAAITATTTTVATVNPDVVATPVMPADEFESLTMVSEASSADEVALPSAQLPPLQPSSSQASMNAGLGSAKRYGSSSSADATLPVEVNSEEEKRFHNDARRFARLLVSEIKLYNEQKVRESQFAGNVYEQLRDDIDRSRQMYDKRVAPDVAARYDYFHHELVNTLAEGDAAKLGPTYPGATVTTTAAATTNTTNYSIT